jgi:hypothetical protein
MEKNYTLKVNNKRLWEFYNNNENVSFEAINLIFLDLIEKINNDMSSTLTNTINSEILDYVKELKNTVSSLTNTIIVKFHDINREYIENIKLILTSSASDNVDKLTTVLDKNTEIFVNRITNEFPKNTLELNNMIKEKLQAFQQVIVDDIGKQLNSTVKSENSINEYIASLDVKIQQFQQPIYSFINANQEQITTSLSTLKEANIVSQANQDKVLNELGDFLNKYRTNSAFKGQSSEHMLENILNKMYPSSEVLDTRAVKECGDYMLRREGKVPILIENKNYDLNVNIDEIKKFLRDIKTQKCSGIFLSQYSGIVSKPNFFIEIHDSNVLIYLHNVEYSQEKIKTAIDVIDSLSNKLRELNASENEEGIIIRKDILDNINKEFQVFINQKELLTTSIKDFQKKMLIQIEDLKMPDLTEYLNSKYASIQNQEWCCDICKASFTKKSSLASHKKIHKEEGKTKNIIV